MRIGGVAVAGLERDAQALRDEAVGDRLVEPAAGQRPADLGLDPLASAARRARQRDRPIFGDVLVAVDPGDLLDQVDLALQVGPPARGPEGLPPVRTLAGFEPQGTQDRLGAVAGDVDPQHPRDLVEAQGDRRALRVGDADVDHAGVEGPAGQLEDQLGAAPAGPFGALGVERALEPVAGRAEQAQGPRRPPDRHRVEARRLDQHVRRLRVDLGVEAPHHPGQADRALGVGDDQHLGGQLVRLVVDRRQRLARAAPADDDLAAFEAVEVVGVQRLAALEHDVVGHVDDVADRPDAQRLEPLAEPPGALADRHARDDPRGEARAEVGRLDAHAGPRLDRGARGGRTRIVLADGPLEEHADLACHADVAQAVGPVAGHLQVDRQVAPHLGGRLVIQARQGQSLGQHLHRHVEPEVIREPIPTDDHRSPRPSRASNLRDPSGAGRTGRRRLP